MRQVRGDGEHLVMVPRLHQLDHAAGAAPELSHPLDRTIVGAGRRGQDAPASFEEFGQACLGPRMLGAGDGMAGDEMDAFGQVGADVADRRLLDRADIADDRAGFERRGNPLGDIRIGAERRADHDQIGADRCRGRIGLDCVDESEPQRRLARGGRAGAAGDGFRQPLSPHDAGERGADQTETDQRNAIEHAGSRHGPILHSHALPLTS